MAELVDYLRSCSKALDGLSSSEEALLSTRAVEEITSSERLSFVAQDQRGSKPLEKLIKKATSETFYVIFQKLMEAFGDLATNQYASHVLETALRSWADRLGQEKLEALKSQPLIAACNTLNEENEQETGSLWRSFACNPCSAHVLRALLMALGGYAHEDQKVAARAGLLPQTKHSVPGEIADCRRKSAASLIKLLKQELKDLDTQSSSHLSLCLDSHASPVIQLLLRLLRDCGDRALLAEACAAVVGAKSANGSVCSKRCEALLGSAAGSRVLEAAVETAGAELFAELFSKFFRRRLLDLATVSGFGPFIAQKVADALRDAAQLQLALAEVDFVACLSSSDSAQHQVVLKFLEAALRLRAGLKQAAGGVFRALGLHASSEYHRAWPTLLCLDAKADVAALWKAENVLRRFPSAGPMLLAMLLRFPAETVAPITSGLTKMLSKEILVALALETRTARVLEAALAPSSALAARRQKLAKVFQGSMGVLGPHPCGGWVCAALWRASLGTPLREAFAKELLEVEEKLRRENFAVWKVCGLHQVKVRREEWMQQQNKAGKVQALFEDLLAAEDQEALKAAKQRRARAAEDEALSKAVEDPTVAALMPCSEDASEVPAEELRQQAVQQGQQAQQAPLAADPSLQEALLLIKGKALRRKRKRGEGA